MHTYPWQMDPPGQSSNDALNTTMSNLAHLMADLYIYIYVTGMKTGMEMKQ